MTIEESKQLQNEIIDLCYSAYPDVYDDELIDNLCQVVIDFQITEVNHD